MSKIKTFGSHLVDFSLIPENGLFIDAGACQGNFINDIQLHASEPFIIAIEPNRQNFKDLKARDYDRVMLINAALVGSCEPKKMAFNDFNEVGLHEWGNVTGLYSNRSHKTYDVKTIDIREVLGMLPNKTVHHLKMDIEGCEHQVVADLTTTQAEMIQQISMEVHNGLQDLEGNLKKLGYNTNFEKGELYAVRKTL
jgi:FkbM family methyltransferase